MTELAFLAAGVLLSLFCARSAAAIVDDHRRADVRWRALAGVTMPSHWWYLGGRVRPALAVGFLLSSAGIVSLAMHPTGPTGWLGAAGSTVGAGLLIAAELARHRLGRGPTVMTPRPGS